MNQPPPAPRIGKMWWWYGIFFLLSLIALCGPIWTCGRCSGKGAVALPKSTVMVRCDNCYGLGRVGLLRKGD